MRAGERSAEDANASMGVGATNSQARVLAAVGEFAVSDAEDHSICRCDGGFDVFFTLCANGV